MLIAVDVGNTSIKLGCFAEPSAAWPQPAQTLSLSTRDMTTWQALAELPIERAAWFVGTVHREAETQLAKWVAHHRPQDAYRKLENTDLPIKVALEFPERVGIDRLLAAVAANHLRDKQAPAIVIDAGTAVTVDVVSADGSFQGGVIWPGWRMMAETLAGNTDALPLVTAALTDGPPPIIGKSTDKAIRSGLFWGNVGAVREFVERMRSELATEPQVFVTGGDAERLATLACHEPRRVEELVLAGIVLAARSLS
jgi:type III pantothenate kinase